MTPFVMTEEARAWLDSVNLGKGAHEPDGIACAMEAVARISNQEWSDAPPNTSSVIGAFMRNWNDNLPDDATRNRLLKPLLLDIVDTKSTLAIERRRSYMALDWFIREHVPAWLDLTPTLKPSGDALRAAGEIVDAATLKVIRKQLEGARDKASAAWAAAGAAAGAALRSTTERLQASAQNLVRTMCAVTE